jgi:hypothetical protein
MLCSDMELAKKRFKAMQEECMRVKKVAHSEYVLRHLTPVGHSIYYDLLPPKKAVELEMLPSPHSRRSPAV